MAILIGIGIILLIIYLIVRFVLPFMLIVLGVGGVAGLFVGIFYGIKNYMASILEKINSKALKITMMVITSMTVIIILFYTIAVTYFLYGYLN